MERNSNQLHSDIMSMKFNFEKSKELAPEGYKFLSNYNLKNEETKEDMRDLEWYAKRGDVVIPMAFNMYGERIEGSMAIYTKISK